MVNTGNKIITEEDMNPLSETYGQTRETIVFDPVTCPPGIDFKARLSTSQVSNKYVYCNGETTLISSELDEYDYGKVTTLAIGLCVDYIGDELFYSSSTDNTTLRSVALSSTVETIGESAFANCRSLSSVTFVSGLTLIKRHAFNMCTSLAGNIVLPNTVTTIRDNAFYGCSRVSSFTLGTGVTYLGANVFRNCTGLNSVTVLATTPPSFGGYYNFTDTNDCPIYVPAGTLSAYESASGWSVYADRIFEYGVAKWVEQSYECELDGSDERTGNIIVTELDTNPSSSTYNTTRTRTYEDLSRCPLPEPTYNFKLRKTFTGGTEVDVACNSSTTLQQSECNGNFESAIVGDCVTTINASAFYQKTSLLNVIISRSVTSIGNYAFSGCTSLTSVTVRSTTPPSVGGRSFSSTNDCPIYVPASSVDTYKAASGWSTYASRIQAIPT